MIDRGARYYPALKAALPFAAGIVIGSLGLDGGAALVLLSLSLLALVLSRVSVHPLRPVAIVLVLFSAGALAYAVRHGSAAAVEGERLAGADMIARVASRPVLRRGRIEFTADLDSIVYRRIIAHPRWTVLLRIEDSTAGELHLAPGDRIVVRGTLSIPGPSRNPGEPDARSILRSRGLDARFTAQDRAAVTVIARAEPGAITQVIERMRDGARSFAVRHVRGEEGDIVRALLLGERDGIDEETTDIFRRTGTIHVLSVSGLHVAVIALGLFVLVSWIPDRRLQLLVFAAAIFLYTVVAGAAPPILRAALMSIAIMVARVSSRISRPLNTLGLAALVILALDPSALFDVGFQLSFASVAGIVMLYAPLVDAVSHRIPARLRRGPLSLLGAVGKLMLLSLSAQLFTAPLAAYHFGFLSLAGSIANVPAVPLTSIALGASAAGALVDPLSSTVASWLGGAAYLALRLTESIVEWCAGLPAAGIILRPPSMIAAVLLGVAVLYAALARSNRQMMIRTAAAACAAASILLIDSAADPLGRFDDRSVALLAARNAVIPVTRAADGSLLALARPWSEAERASAAYVVEAFRRRIGAPLARIDSSFDRPALDRTEYMTLGAEPGDLAHRRLPMLVTAGRRRALGTVMAAGERMIQIPLRGRMEEGMILDFDNDWEIIGWH